MRPPAQPPAKQSATKRSGTQQSATKQRAPKAQVSKPPSAERPASRKPTPRAQATNPPSAKQPATKRPVTNPPSAKQPVSKQSVAKHIVAKQPDARESGPVSTQFGERLAERRAAVRKLRWRWLIVAGSVALVLVILAWVVLASPLLALRGEGISIEGTGELVSEEEVRAAIVPSVGTPLARVDTDALSDAVQEIVAVREVEISRDWPHGLQVHVTPRQPVALVADGEQAEKQYAVLDGTGVVLKRLEEPVDGLPVVDVPLGEEKTEASLAAVLAVMDALPQDLLEQVTAASAPSAHEVQFELENGAEVFWGAATENALKASVLNTLLQVKALSYDVSAPRAPITNGEELVQ